MKPRKLLKPGQLFTFNNHVYQVRKTPRDELSCIACLATNSATNNRTRRALCRICCETTNPRTFLKKIK